MGSPLTVKHDYFLVDTAQVVDATFCSAASGCWYDQYTSTRWRHKVFSINTGSIPVEKVEVTVNSKRKWLHDVNIWVSEFKGPLRNPTPRHTRLCGSVTSSQNDFGSVEVVCGDSSVRGRFLHMIVPSSMGTSSVIASVAVTKRLPFAVAASGQVTVNARLDFEVQASYIIQVFPAIRFTLFVSPLVIFCTAQSMFPSFCVGPVVSICYTLLLCVALCADLYFTVSGACDGQLRLLPQVA